MLCSSDNRQDYIKIDNKNIVTCLIMLEAFFLTDTCIY